jgi:ABC-type bacteriocin/lantibiotic exporter with double-glycine peptidase domain
VIVGPSGSGKSSVIQLMENFYQPSEGSILFHGVDLRNINVRYVHGLSPYFSSFS